MFNFRELSANVYSKAQADAYLQQKGILDTIRPCPNGHALSLDVEKDRWRCGHLFSLVKFFADLILAVACGCLCSQSGTISALTGTSVIQQLGATKMIRWAKSNTTKHHFKSSRSTFLMEVAITYRLTDMGDTDVFLYRLACS